MKMQEAPPHKIDRPSNLNRFKPKLRELMSREIFTFVVLMERLKDAVTTADYNSQDMSIPSVRQSPAGGQAFETPSGKQTQMDWGICQYDDRELFQNSTILAVSMSLLAGLKKRLLSLLQPFLQYPPITKSYYLNLLEFITHETTFARISAPLPFRWTPSSVNISPLFRETLSTAWLLLTKRASTNTPQALLAIYSETGASFK